MVVLDHDGLAGFCDGHSVDCDFDHCELSFVVLRVDDWAMKTRWRRWFVSTGIYFTHFL